jgi:hypothetical protein
MTFCRIVPVYKVEPGAPGPEWYSSSKTNMFFLF